MELSLGSRSSDGSGAPRPRRASHRGDRLVRSPRDRRSRIRPCRVRRWRAVAIRLRWRLGRFRSGSSSATRRRRLRTRARGHLLVTPFRRCALARSGCLAAQSVRRGHRASPPQLAWLNHDGYRRLDEREPSSPTSSSRPDRSRHRSHVRHHRWIHHPAVVPGFHWHLGWFGGDAMITDSRGSRLLFCVARALDREKRGLQHP